MSAVHFSAKHWQIFEADAHDGGGFAARIGGPMTTRGKHASITADGRVTYFKTYAEPESGRASPGFMRKLEIMAGAPASQVEINYQARTKAQPAKERFAPKIAAPAQPVLKPPAVRSSIGNPMSAYDVKKTASYTPVKDDDKTILHPYTKAVAHHFHRTTTSHYTDAQISAAIRSAEALNDKSPVGRSDQQIVHQILGYLKRGLIDDVHPVVSATNAVANESQGREITAGDPPRSSEPAAIVRLPDTAQSGRGKTPITISSAASSPEPQPIAQISEKIVEPDISYAEADATRLPASAESPSARLWALLGPGSDFAEQNKVSAFAEKPLEKTETLADSRAQTEVEPAISPQPVSRDPGLLDWLQAPDDEQWNLPAWDGLTAHESPAASPFQAVVNAPERSSEAAPLKPLSPSTMGLPPVTPQSVVRNAPLIPADRAASSPDPVGMPPSAPDRSITKHQASWSAMTARTPSVAASYLTNSGLGGSSVGSDRYVFSAASFTSESSSRYKRARRALSPFNNERDRANMEHVMCNIGPSGAPAKVEGDMVILGDVLDAMLSREAVFPSELQIVEQAFAFTVANLPDAAFTRAANLQRTMRKIRAATQSEAGGKNDSRSG